MWLDVSDLWQFYRSPLGLTARRMIRRQIRALWPDLTGQSLLTIGYGTPYLRPYLEQAERVAAVMPAMQGVTRWPAEGPSRVTLADETQLPFQDVSFDRVLLIHAVEHSEQVRPLMREAWRVLAGEGRLLVVVPNRRGLWARLERTPFGYGRPYSPGQLDRLLRDTLFLPRHAEHALYAPPSRARFVLRLAAAWERIGYRWATPFSGVLLAEAEKQIYTPPRLREERLVRRPRPAIAAPGSP
jgi:SAM-dependent methyltransferase